MTTESSAHRSELVALLPQLRQQLTQLLATLDSARTTAEVGELGERAPEADAISQALTAARWTLDALDPAATPKQRADNLTEAAVRCGYVITAAHRRLAELQTPADIAAQEEERRMGALELGELLINQADLIVSQFDDDDAETRHRVTIRIADDGRLAWESDTLALRTPSNHDQLALTATLITQAEALHKASSQPAG
ncbi:hypothetical protein [Amycolatopsis sp. RTGN1]|uniref:hypothetical protein n=1 Tax=Amycolatopsis ponsaeliensis TaxID=2992142 RepID=UPI00254A0936|nr:hypothetical protein [Amycolatopsis sp. RTGN1]